MIFQMGRLNVKDEGEALKHDPETHAGSLVTRGLA